MKKIDYISIIALLGCMFGMIKYLVLYINNNQTIDLVAFIIITVVFITLVSSYVIVKIIRNKRNIKWPNKSVNQNKNG